MRLLLAVVVLGSCTYGQTVAGVKIVQHTETKTTGVPGMAWPEERTIISYAQGSNRRTEFPLESLRNVPPMKMILIQRCDTRVIYSLNPDKREYTETHSPSPKEEAKARQETQRKWSEGPPNLVIESTTVDTGETKYAFGHTARHYVTTIKETPAPELGQQPSEIVQDAWYLDVPDVTTCEPVSRRPRGLIVASVSGGEIRKLRPKFTYSGPEPQGMILSEKTTTRSVHVFQTGEKQNTVVTTSAEIVEISNEAIDPAIFDVPAGFTKVKQFTR